MYQTRGVGQHMTGHSQRSTQTLSIYSPLSSRIVFHWSRGLVKGMHFSYWFEYAIMCEGRKKLEGIIYILCFRGKKNRTLYFSNKIKTIDHNDLIFSGIHIHPWPHVSCKFGYDILRNKVTAMILVKHAKPV